MPRIKFKDREWVKRWRAESPDFFKKLQTIGVKLTVLGGLICIVPIPGAVVVGGAMGLVGTTMGTVSKFTVKTPSKEDVEKLKAEIELLKAKLN